MQFAKADAPADSLIWRDCSWLKQKVMYNYPYLNQGELP